MNFLFRWRLIFLTSSLLSFSVLASDQLVQSLSEGACWYDLKDDTIKLSSFNDKVTLQFNKDDLLAKLSDSLNLKHKNQSPLIIHCSGMGHSFITKLIDEKNASESCLWFAVNDDEIVVRSIGGVEDEKSDFCDGFKKGEVLLGLSHDGDFNWIKDQDQFKDTIESYVKVTAFLYKVKLKDHFIGKEKMVIVELKKLKGVKYTELNKFQHSVGEWATLD